MPVKRRLAKRRELIDEDAEAWLRGEPCGFFEFKPAAELAALWAEHAERIVDEHVARWPGSRPLRWWDYDAPEPLGTNETQAAYLARHGLLMAGERRSVARPTGDDLL
jgi:hypothetical protein